MDSLTHQLSLMQGLLAAFVLSGVIGWQREQSLSHVKTAGLRTHILVGVSAALFIVLGESLVVSFAKEDDQVRFDMIGVLGAVVSGVSFLGAGAIFSAKGGEGGGTKGLTTAAGLLATAAVGVACGLHLYALAAGATLLFWLTLGPLAQLADRHRP